MCTELIEKQEMESRLLEYFPPALELACLFAKDGNSTRTALARLRRLSYNSSRWWARGGSFPALPPLPPPPPSSYPEPGVTSGGRLGWPPFPALASEPPPPPRGAPRPSPLSPLLAARLPRIAGRSGRAGPAAGSVRRGARPGASRSVPRLGHRASPTGSAGARGHAGMWGEGSGPPSSPGRTP